MPPLGTIEIAPNCCSLSVLLQSIAGNSSYFFEDLSPTNPQNSSSQALNKIKECVHALQQGKTVKKEDILDLREKISSIDPIAWKDEVENRQSFLDPLYNIYCQAIYGHRFYAPLPSGALYSFLLEKILNQNSYFDLSTNKSKMKYRFEVIKGKPIYLHEYLETPPSSPLKDCKEKGLHRVKMDPEKTYDLQNKDCFEGLSQIHTYTKTFNHGHTTIYRKIGDTWYHFHEKPKWTNSAAYTWVPAVTCVEPKDLPSKGILRVVLEKKSAANLKAR